MLNRGGVITPSGVSSTTSGETVDISTVYPDGVISTSKENALQTGIGASSGGQAVWSGNDLIVSADQYGLYSENENSLINISINEGIFSVSSTYAPIRPLAALDNFGIWAGDSGSISISSDVVNVSVDRSKENYSTGIHVEENGSVQINASTITIEALNSGRATNTKAYAIETLSGGILELGNENTSRIYISSETNSSTEFGGAGRDNRAIRASDNSNIALSASEISIEANGYNTTAIEAVEGGQIDIGNENSNVSISSIGSSQVVGVRSDDVNSSINITADTVSIHTENTSEDGYSVGLMALNNSQSSTRPDDSASINITANTTTITSDGVGVSAYSNSRVNLDTGLVLNAPTAIEARGNSLLNINPNGDKTVVIKGDVSFGRTDTDSGNILDAEVNINLSGAQSEWKGNVKVDYPTNGNTDTTITKGVTLSLSDQAQWTPNKISETDADGQTVKAQALNVLKLNDGVVNLGSDLGTVEIKELQGTGGTINAEATKDDNGNFVSSTVQIGEVSNTDGSTPSMTVKYTGITADDLSDVAADMKSLANQTIKTETQDAVDQTFNVEEGNIRGAVTSGYDADGNLSTHQAKNVKLTDYGALNSMTFVQWRNEINHLTKRLGDIRASESSIGAWARVYGGESQWKSNSEIEMDHTTIQVGADYRINNHWIVGGAFSYTDSDADLVKGQAKGDSYSLAAYATYMADGGSYLDLIARYGYLDNEMTSGNMSVDTQSNAFSLSVETGHMFRIMEQAYIEPQIEVTYGFISGDDATASNGVRLDQDDFQSLITRVGVRTGFEFPEKAGTIYAMLSYSYDFLGDADGTASQGGLREALNEDLGGGWVSYGIGAQFKLGDNAFAYGELERTSGGEIDNPYLFNVGFRWNF